MKIVLIIAKDAVRMLLRQRILMAIIIVSCLLTLFFSVGYAKARTHLGSQMALLTDETLSQLDNVKNLKVQSAQIKQAMDTAGMVFQGVFHGTVSFAGSLVVLLIFCTAVTSEIRSGTIRVTLSKPVSRWQFLLGKYLGGLTVMAGYSAVTALALVVFVHIQGSTSSPALNWAPWLMFCKHLMLGSFALWLSLWMHPTLAGVFAYFGSAGFLHWYIHQVPLMRIPYAMLPSYERFNIIGDVVTGTLIDPQTIVMLSLYAGDFIVIMLLLAIWRFRSMEII